MKEKEIRIALVKAGLRLCDIDKAYDLPKGTSCLAILAPSKKGEEALSKALRIPAYELFPNRYDRDGKRLKPQPTYHYYKSKRQLLSEQNDDNSCPNSTLSTMGNS